jgi:hypothetical protein
MENRFVYEEKALGKSLEMVFWGGESVGVGRISAVRPGRRNVQFFFHSFFFVSETPYRA